MLLKSVELQVRLAAAIDGVNDQRAPAWRPDIQRLASLRLGIGPDEAEIFWSDTRTIPTGGFDVMNLDGGLLDPYGNTLFLENIVGVIIMADPSNETVLTLGGGPNPWSSMFGGTAHTAKIMPGGVFMNFAPSELGLGDVVSGSAHNLRLTNDTGKQAAYVIAIIARGTILGPGLIEEPPPAPETNAPIIADQTIVFGRLTAAGAGGFQLASAGGAITGSTTNTLTGTNANHFAISSTGLITPTSNFVASPQNSYTLTATVYNADGADTATLTIPTIANAKSVLTLAELNAAWDAFLALNAAAYTIYGRSASVGDFSKSAAAFTNRITVTSHDPVNAFTLSTITINDCDRVSLLDLKVSSAPANNKILVQIQGPCIDPIVEGCDIGSNVVVDCNADWSAGYFSEFYGIRCVNSGGMPNSITITNCFVHDVARPIAPSATGSVVVEGCTVDRFYDLAINTSAFNGLPPTVETKFNWNTVSRPFSRETDAPLPHADCLYLQCLGMTADWLNAEMIGNITYLGSTRGRAQGIFVANTPSGRFVEIDVMGNILEVGMARAISIDRARNCRVIGNTTYRGAGTNAIDGSLIAVGVDAALVATAGVTYVAATNIVQDNIAVAFAIEPTATVGGNYDVGNFVTEYSTLFAGTFGVQTTKAATIAMYTQKAGGPLDTPSPKIGAVPYTDYTAKTFSSPRLSGPYTQTRRTADGANDYLTMRVDGTTGKAIAASAVGTISCWVDLTSADGVNATIAEFSQQRVWVYRAATSGKITVELRTAGYSTLAAGSSADTVFDSDGLSHVIVTWNLTGGTPVVRMAIRNTVQTISFSTSPVAGSVGWEGAFNDAGLFANGDGTLKLAGAVGDLWIDTRYFDISNVTELRKFIDASGNPVDLAPLGTPLIHFGGSMTLANWNAGNHIGSMNDWTVNGAFA